MEVFWFEQTEADVPGDAGWLTAAETNRQSALAFPKRRADWRLGRWTAKCAIARLLPCLGLQEIEIRAAPSGAPEVFVHDRRYPMTISITHSNGRACCAATRDDGTLGCDLEKLEPRPPLFVADYFSDREREMIALDPMLATVLWSAKESALKALRVGLRENTRSVTVSRLASAGLLAFDAWRPLCVRHGATQFDGWWQCDRRFARTVVSDPPAPCPRAF